ncbi:STAS domain-containing protein [Paenibacillus sp. sgz500958]|uniref:STAS domain-containing protein n=1 Tax=Paenibacillus sp. sgz500958 TaxID=3242475 RepID=UPI0036D40FD9
MGESIIIMPEIFAVDEAARFRESVLVYFNGKSGEPVHLVLDFSTCQFIDSTGLGVIVSTYKKCLEVGGNLKLKSLSANVMKVFEMTRLHRVFEIL